MFVYTGIGTPQLVDADWRLDYHIKSNITGNDNEPLYTLRLRLLEANGKVEEVRLAANLEELQDMLARVKDATKQV